MFRKLSIMLAAAKAGRSVPKLCATDMLEAFGSCTANLNAIAGRCPFSPTSFNLVPRIRSP